MSSTRVQLTADELDTLVTLLPMQHFKLKAKLQKALIIAGGRAVDKPLSGYDLFASTGVAPKTPTNPQMEHIMAKILNDQPLTAEEKQYYTDSTGIPL